MGICVYYNFSNNKLERIAESIFKYFYYNSQMLFTLSACQIEVSFYDINSHEIPINENNLNVLLLDDKYFSNADTHIINDLIAKFEKNKSILIFLSAKPIGNISTNYQQFDNYDKDKNIDIKIINTIAIIYIQKNYSKINVFISYAREDGSKICQQISNELNYHLGLNHFVDIQSIALGDIAESVIEEACKNENCYMLYVLTDKYKDRYYCNKESYYAKNYDRPGIIYNCIKGETIRTPLLTNCLEIKNNTDSIQFLINGLCQVIIRNKVYLDNASKIQASECLDEYKILNNRFDYSALASSKQQFIYPGNPIYADELKLYNSIKTTEIKSYMECIFSIKNAMNIAISTSEVNTTLYYRLLSESFFDLLLQCLIFSRCKIHTALNLMYFNSKLNRIIDISNNYYDRHLNNNNYEPVCINYLPISDYEAINTKIIAENKKSIEFVKCEQTQDKYYNSREKMIKESECLIIFGGKTNTDFTNSGIYKEYEIALENNKPIIIISKIGGFAEQLANSISEADHPENVFIIDKTNIYAILNEIKNILNSLSAAKLVH